MAGVHSMIEPLPFGSQPSAGFHSSRPATGVLVRPDLARRSGISGHGQRLVQYYWTMIGFARYSLMLRVP